MKNKALIIPGVSALVLLAALGLLALFLGQNPLGNLLLISPVDEGAPAFDLQAVEEIARDRFLLTYEIRRRLTVKTVYAEYPVTLIGTNSRYPALTGYPMLSGGFFTHAAERGKNKEAVLNAAAALLLFGTNNIAGRTLVLEGVPWLVSGVMDDGDTDNPHVYIPAAVTGEGPHALLVLLNNGAGLDAAAVKDAFKPLGIHETSHHFFALRDVLRVYVERFTLALRVLICVFFSIFARGQTGTLKTLVSIIKNRLKHNYPGELVRKGVHVNAGKLAHFTLAVFGLLVGGVFCFSLLPQCLGILLGWGDLPSIAILAKGDFPAIAAPLLDYYYVDMVLFILCLAASGLMLFFESSGSFYRGLNRHNLAGKGEERMILLIPLTHKKGFCTERQ